MQEEDKNKGCASTASTSLKRAKFDIEMLRAVLARDSVPERVVESGRPPLTNLFAAPTLRRCPTGLREPVERNSILSHRKELKDVVSLYSSAIQKVCKDKDCKDLKSLEVEEICEMGNEVRLALTNLLADLDLLQVAKKESVSESILKSKHQAEAMRLAAMADRVKFEAEKAQVATSAREEAKACVICKERPHDVIIFPCLHAHCCNECVEKRRVIINDCPTCRTSIMSTLRYVL